MNRSLLAFSVANVRLGLDAAHVQEVVPAVKLLTPPELPPLIRGFLSISDRLIPVIHLEKLLQPVGKDTPTPAMKLTDRLVIARLKGKPVAWIAGNDVELLPYRTREMTPLPDSHVLNNCAASILPQVPPVILLDPDHLLLEGEHLRLEQLRQREVDRQSLLADAPSSPQPA